MNVCFSCFTMRIYFVGSYKDYLSSEVLILNRFSFSVEKVHHNLLNYSTIAGIHSKRC